MFLKILNHLFLSMTALLIAWSCSCPKPPITTHVETASNTQATQAIADQQGNAPIETVEPEVEPEVCPEPPPPPKVLTDEEKYPQWAGLIRKVNLNRCDDFNLISNKLKYHFTPRARAKRGDEIRFMITSALKGSLHMFEVDHEGEGLLLFPNQYAKQNELKSGEIFEFPPEKMRRKFNFFAEAPPTENIVVAIWSRNLKRNLYHERSVKHKKKKQAEQMIKAVPDLLLMSTTEKTQTHPKVQKNPQDDQLNKFTGGQWSDAIKQNSSKETNFDQLEKIKESDPKNSTASSHATQDQPKNVGDLKTKSSSSKGLEEICADYVIINIAE